MENTKLSELFAQIKSIVTEAEIDTEKVLAKGNDAASVRVRKQMQEIKAVASEIRDIIQDLRK